MREHRLLEHFAEIADFRWVTVTGMMQSVGRNIVVSHSYKIWHLWHGFGCYLKVLCKASHLKPTHTFLTNKNMPNLSCQLYSEYHSGYQIP